MTIADVPAGLAAAADASLRWHPGGPFDLMQTIGTLLRGHGDPSIRTAPDGIWFAFTTPRGPATLRLATAGTAGGPCRGRAGLGSRSGGRRRFRAAHARAATTTGPASTSPRSTPRSRAWWLKPDAGTSPIRLPATGRMIDSLVPTILEQKVTVIEARRGYRYLMYRFGTAAPGAGTVAPANLLVQPTAAQWLRIPSWEWHKAGVGPQRSATVMRALRSAAALERLAALPAAEAAAKLQTLPGIGVWTAAEVVQRTHGCPDSIAVGDYHLAAYVGAALTGRRTDDAGMLRLLAPWAGHRQRVVRMIGLSGFRKPTFGPRMTIQDHRGH